MKAHLDTSGLDAFSKRLKELDGSHQVSTNDLMTVEFIQENSDFDTWEQLMNTYPIQSDEDIESPGFSEFVAEKTKFESFEAMLEEAGGEWVKRKLLG